jgi:hypothetical protein
MRAAWTADDQRTTMAILAEGEFRVDLPGHSIILTRQGDYMAWPSNLRLGQQN